MENENNEMLIPKGLPEEEEGIYLESKKRAIELIRRSEQFMIITANLELNEKDEPIAVNSDTGVIGDPHALGHAFADVMESTMKDGSPGPVKLVVMEASRVKIIRKMKEEVSKIVTPPNDIVSPTGKKLSDN